MPNDEIQEGECNQHPDAPHGFDRNASHSLGRYACECESWEPTDFDDEDKGDGDASL